MDKPKSQSKETEKLILGAAHEIFLNKGFDGARMQEIADRAGINKSLLHYYFRSKDKLFLAVFSDSINEMAGGLQALFNSDQPLKEKINQFFELHIGFLQKNPRLPHFILNEIARNPDKVKGVFEDNLPEKLLSGHFFEEINKSVEQGEIKPIEPFQLILNIMSLSIFPFVVAPLIKELFNISDEDYDILINERKQHMSEFFNNALS